MAARIKRLKYFFFLAYNVRVIIDIRKTVMENAQLYFEKSKKAREKAAGARKALAQTQLKMKKVEETEIKETPVMEKKVKKELKWYEKFHWFYSSEGILVISGKDATSNEIIVKKYVQDNHTVLHSDIAGSPFTLIFGDNFTDKTIEEAAIATASYSRAWKEGYRTLDVYWVLGNQISKSAPAGEYLTKGSFMIYGKKNYLRNIELKLAVGLDKEINILSGPITSLKSKVVCYVPLVPGGNKSGHISKQLLEHFRFLYPDQRQAALNNDTVNDIQKCVPAGKGEVLFKESWVDSSLIKEKKT